PRFNVKYRDDKSYPWLAITLNEEYPRVMVGRGAKKKGVRYFGPYSHAWAIRETVDLLLRVFPMRSCSNGVFRRSSQIGRPCLLGYIDKCAAPCVGRVTAEEHRLIVDDFCDFMAGHTAAFVKRAEQEMYAASAAQDYEKAARLRDDLGALNRALEKQAVVLGDGTDCDVVAVEDDPLEVAVQIFHVRGGRVRGQRGWVAEKTDDADLGGLVERFLQQLYAGESPDAVPREILVPALPDDVEALEAWLSGLRGSRVGIRVPQRGDKKTLQETVARNAKQTMALHKTRRASDLTTRNQAIEDLQTALGLPEAPLRIECYDISNLQGSQAVGSMVVFEDGLPRKSEYRRFEIRSVEGQDDVASLREVLTRRLARLASERDEPEEADDRGRRRKFAYPPNLIVVDGGRPQLAAALDAVRASASPDLAVVSLAKRMEEVYVPGTPDPVVIPRTSEALYLLQRVRDEAHRFAITYHRKLRDRSMTRSVLDGIPGVGETRRRQLVRHFGSARRAAQASLEELEQVPGLGPQLAKVVYDHLHGGGSGRLKERGGSPPADRGAGQE
ncbi:MAG: excinuclease ABC subunit UvrC, partial [Actinomycetes bacterium]